MPMMTLSLEIFQKEYHVPMKFDQTMMTAIVECHAKALLLVLI